jgi:hypothetical protein
MKSEIILLSQHPEIARVIRSVDPKYRKHKAIIAGAERVTLSGTYWDGGSRSSYTAVNLETGLSIDAPQYSPPQFGGPKVDPVVELPEGVVIVRTGIFCGKTETAKVFVNPANLTKFLPFGE